MFFEIYQLYFSLTRGNICVSAHLERYFFLLIHRIHQSHCHCNLKGVNVQFMKHFENIALNPNSVNYLAKPTQ